MRWLMLAGLMLAGCGAADRAADDRTAQRQAAYDAAVEEAQRKWTEWQGTDWPATFTSLDDPEVAVDLLDGKWEVLSRLEYTIPRTSEVVIVEWRTDVQWLPDSKRWRVGTIEIRTVSRGDEPLYYDWVSL